MSRDAFRSRGFTLLEVLVAVAILGLGLTAILSAQAGAFSSAAYARNISVATGLVRCKVSEVEEHLYKDGFQETDESGAGVCCEGDETPDFRCVWRIERPTFPEARFGDLNLSAGLDLAGGAAAGSSGGPAGGLGALGMLTGMGAGAGAGPSPLAGASSLGDVAKTLTDANSQLGSGMPPPATTGTSTIPGSTTGAPPGADPGAAAGMGGLASMAMSLVYPNLKLLFEASTRRITVQVIFREGKQERNIEVVEWFAVPQKGLTVDDQSAADTDSSSTTTTRNSTKEKTR